MPKCVSFTMTWSCSGKQSIDLPDDIDPKDTDAIIEYIQSCWPDIPIPDGDYIPESDELDTSCEITVYNSDIP